MYMYSMLDITFYAHEKVYIYCKHSKPKTVIRILQNLQPITPKTARKMTSDMAKKVTYRPQDSHKDDWRYGEVGNLPPPRQPER